MRNTLFTGCATALITPFADEKIDFDLLGILIDRQLDAGTDALVVLGTTGEPTTMTEDECESVIDFVVRRVRGRIPVIVGAGDNDTRRAVAKCTKRQDLGADALLVVTPYYNKATQDGLIAHFSTIADAVSIPVIVYNVPSRTGVNLLPETAAALSEHPRIAGLKEADPSIVQLSEAVRLCGADFSVYAGNDDLILPALAVGARGVISVAANVWPSQVKALTDYFFAGDLCSAQMDAHKMARLIQLLFREVSPIPTKAALMLMGLGSGAMRLPLTKATNALVAALSIELKRIGLVS